MALRETIQLPVDKDMTSALAILHPVALLNKQAELRQVYCDCVRGIGIVGYRRQVANFGVVFMKLQYGEHVEVEVGKNDFRRQNGSYYYVTKGYSEHHEGLEGAEIKDGVKERVAAEEAIEKIEEIRDNSTLRHEVLISPGTFVKYVRDRMHMMNKDITDRKINIGFTAGLPVGTYIGMAIMGNDGEFSIKVEFNFKDKPTKYLDCLIHKDSLTPIKKLQHGRYYLVQPPKSGGIDPKTKQRYINVVRPYQSGIRVAIQHLPNGILRPNSEGYILTANKNHGVKTKMITNMDFMREQDFTKIANAPMLTFDLDIFHAVMTSLSGYPVVKMQFRDSSSGVYFFAKGDQYMPDAEVIIGPTSQIVRGRVCLP